MVVWLWLFVDVVGLRSLACLRWCFRWWFLVGVGCDVWFLFLLVVLGVLFDGCSWLCFDWCALVCLTLTSLFPGRFGCFFCDLSYL